MSRRYGPKHRLVSLVSNIARDGSANRFDAVMELADETEGRHYLPPAPVVANTVDERAHLLQQWLYLAGRAVADAASAGSVRVGAIGGDAPPYQGGLVSDAELAGLMERGAARWARSWSGRWTPASGWWSRRYRRG